MKPKNLSEAEYLEPFRQDRPERKDKIEAALDRAWKNRDFEIDKYWSRATYFWAFIAATFAGYFTIASSAGLDDNEVFRHRFLFIVTCIGIIFSLSWLLVNIGSKKWQENWEKHIDMLEDEITGPLYKTVLAKHSYSVSRINILVSCFILFVWIGLFTWEIVDSAQSCPKCRVDIVKILSGIVTIYFVGALIWNTRTKVTGKPYRFKRRSTSYLK